MRSVFILILFGTLLAVARAEVTVTVYEADGESIFDYRPILSGTQLVFKVSGDQNLSWGGSLVISSEDELLGELYARGPQYFGDWTGSHLNSAGEDATVYDWEDSEIDGFDLYTGRSPVIGNWFVLDYIAQKAGPVGIDFYDHSMSMYDPQYTITINQTPEPVSILLMGFGCSVLAYRKSYKKT